MSTPIGIGIVGYGYWGPNMVRNVADARDLRLAGVCEPDAERATRAADRHPGVPVHAELDAMLDDPAVEAVIVATPPRTHFDVASRALVAGRHVLVEKPMARTSIEAITLIELAVAARKVLMPGHTFLYSPPVNLVRDLVADGQLGDVYFVTSSRMNLGKYQPDGVICDLAPHDLSILLHWLDEPLVRISAVAQEVFQDEVPETAFLTAHFAGGTTANLQLSWLAPRKVRQTIVVGSRRMVHYEDTSADEAVRLYDRGLDFSPPESFGEYRLTYRTGDMIAPRIEAAEPLALELADFAEAVRTGREPRSNALLGLEIVLALEAAAQSLREGGRPVDVAQVRQVPQPSIQPAPGARPRAADAA
jgi:predicted dehydrogenase